MGIEKAQDLLPCDSAWVYHPIARPKSCDLGCNHCSFRHQTVANIMDFSDICDGGDSDRIAPTR